ncbi:MAG: hypothetical protein ACP5OG_00915 [Candidatus Nanoarchaeia archaeon]
MVNLEDLEIKELVTLYSLEEYNYLESASGTALSCGCSEPKEEKTIVHGIFGSSSLAKEKLENLVKQRINQGYSKPNYLGGEQSKLEKSRDYKEPRTLCTQISINPVTIEKSRIQKTENGLSYNGFVIE